jgi:alginate O-acetyltransferase complex protein AlgI
MSPSFLLPLGAVIVGAIAFYLAKAKYRFAVLLCLSFIYYVLATGTAIISVAFLIVINFIGARAITVAHLRSRKWIYSCILGFNIAYWLFFKLYHGGSNIPLGLSFFVFAIIGCQVDVFRRKTTTCPEIADLSFFILWAPKISQGPIERYDRLLSQKKAKIIFSNHRITSGLRLILFGIFKKIMIADRLGPFVSFVYDQPFHFSGIQYLMATVFFAFQIYADFSGYTDIARGTSRLFGYELIFNFKQPYLAKSIREFWSRWHISLSSWLRDYLYLPLAFGISNRLKNERYLLISTDKLIYAGATSITFLICGMWHGLRATFIVWGFLFGAYLICSAWLRKSRIRKAVRGLFPACILGLVQTLSTFALVCIAWIVFRSAAVASAWAIIREIPIGLVNFVKDALHVLGRSENPKILLKPLLMGQPKEEFLLAAICISFLLLVDYFQDKMNIAQKLDQLPVGLRWGIYYAMIVAILFFGAFNSARSFIYVQF